jgi:hypothetical protein
MTILLRRIMKHDASLRAVIYCVQWTRLLFTSTRTRDAYGATKSKPTEWNTFQYNAFLGGPNIWKGKYAKSYSIKCCNVNVRIRCEYQSAMAKSILYTHINISLTYTLPIWNYLAYAMHKINEDRSMSGSTRRTYSSYNLSVYDSKMSQALYIILLHIITRKRLVLCGTTNRGFGSLNLTCYRHLVWLLEWGIATSQELYLQGTQRVKTRTYIHASSGTGTHRGGY